MARPNSAGVETVAARAQPLQHPTAPQLRLSARRGDPVGSTGPKNDRPAVRRGSVLMFVWSRLRYRGLITYVVINT